MNGIRLSVFTVSTPDMDPGELAAAARAAGIEGIEWRCQDVPESQKDAAPSFWGNNRCSIPTRWTESDLELFRSAAADHGVTSVAVVPYLTPGDMAATNRVLQAAAYLGASMIRLGVYGYDRSRPYPELFAAERAYLKQAEALCRACGVKGVVEIHHQTIAPSASAAYRLVEGLDPAHIGVLFDPGNMVHEGYENYRLGLELLGPYLAHVHVKNAGWKALPESRDGEFVRWRADWAGLNRGMVDWPQVIADLKAVGYQGYIGVEDFSGERPTREMLAFFADVMKRLL